MPIDADYAEYIQGLGMGAEVVLYEIDLTIFGGPILLLTPMNSQTEDPIEFGGQVYNPFPIIAEGFEWVAGQAPPSPTVSVGNIAHALTSYVLSFQNLIGAKFRRIRTFARFLDSGEEPNSDAHMPIEVYRIDKKLSHNERAISWELASWIDQQGVQLPRRLVIRDYCSLIYRNGSSGVFDYSKATCPYTDEGAGDLFTENNETTADVASDICPKTLKACRLRFGENSNLPFGGFPGVSKLRKF